MACHDAKMMVPSHLQLGCCAVAEHLTQHRLSCKWTCSSSGHGGPGRGAAVDLAGILVCEPKHHITERAGCHAKLKDLQAASCIWTHHATWANCRNPARMEMLGPRFHVTVVMRHDRFFNAQLITTSRHFHIVPRWSESNQRLPDFHACRQLKVDLGSMPFSDQTHAGGLWAWHDRQHAL